METVQIKDGEAYKFDIGKRVRYYVPERGGYGYGFGDVLKVNKKTLLVSDKKHDGQLLVDKSLVFEEIKFEPVDEMCKADE